MIRNVIQSVYDSTLRPYLPRKYRVLNGVALHDAALFDAVDHEPQWKHGVVEAVHEHVSDGTVVGVIGFGGVVTVHALRAGARAVHGYEAAQSMIERGLQAVEANGCDANAVTTTHAVVGAGGELWGDASSAVRLEPDSLPDVEVLVVDCEGGELSILPDVRQPPTVICETHPTHDAGTAAVVEAFPDRYETAVRPYEPGSDKRVVVGRQ